MGIDVPDPDVPDPGATDPGATDPGATDPDQPVAPEDDQAQAAPVPWWRRKAVLVGTALVAAVALVGSLVLAFSGT